MRIPRTSAFPAAFVWNGSGAYRPYSHFSLKCGRSAERCNGRALSNGLDVKYKAYTDALEQILADDTVAALLSDNEIMAMRHAPTAA